MGADQTVEVKSLDAVDKSQDAPRHVSGVVIPGFSGYQNCKWKPFDGAWVNQIDQ